MSVKPCDEGKTLVFNIQKCSIHDGPGIRTIVFLKGCPLRCLWCANPESQSYQKEIADTQPRCINCGVCIEKCPEGCISLQEDGHGIIDREKCTVCGICTDICYAKSKRIVGEEKSVEELMASIRKDKAYYINSGGGITFSGGEPLTHPEFLLEAARECKKLGLNVTIESCGYADFDRFAPALEYIDLIYMDVKEIDPEIHKRLTGADNQKIIDNLKQIDRLGNRMIIRIPVIPGYNDRDDNFTGIARLAAEITHVDAVELLAYHDLGAHKYPMLGREYAVKDVKTPSEEQMDQYVALMNEVLSPVGKKCFFEHKPKAADQSDDLLRGGTLNC